MQARAPGPVASSQQSHLAKLRHTEPGVHETRDAPDRRLADRATLEREVMAWQAARNHAGRGVDWRFTTEDARIKLKHLYPTTQD